jgi:hypothetical protein
MPFSLDVVDGGAAGAHLDIPDSGLVVGRAAQPPGELEGDPALSREHARFTPRGDGVLVVEDLGSTNGTRVNGALIGGPTAARAGDVVQVGGTTLRVFARKAAATTHLPVVPATPDRARPAGGPSEAGDDGEARLRDALFAWLSRDPEGRELLVRLDSDPAGAARPLAEWIRDRRGEAPAQLATYVSGGHVERLVNIARADAVHIHEPPKHLWDKVANAHGAALLFLMLGIGAVVGGIASFGYVVVSFIDEVWSKLGSSNPSPDIHVQFSPWAPLGLALEVVGVVMIILSVGASARDRRKA